MAGKGKMLGKDPRLLRGDVTSWVAHFLMPHRDLSTVTLFC